MIVQSVYIGKPVDYSPGNCKVYGVLTIAYKNNNYWVCVGQFDQAYLRPKTVMSRRNKTCWKGKYGCPFNDDHQYIRMIAEDSFTLLHMKLYDQNYKAWISKGIARTLEEMQDFFKDSDPVLWSTRRLGPPIIDYANPKNIIYNQPTYYDFLSDIEFPDARPEEIKPLIQEALERCTGQLMSEILLATTDYHFISEGEWDFLKKEGAV